MRGSRRRARCVSHKKHAHPSALTQRTSTSDAAGAVVATGDAVAPVAAALGTHLALAAALVTGGARQATDTATRRVRECVQCTTTASHSQRTSPRCGKGCRRRRTRSCARCSPRRSCSFRCSMGRVAPPACRATTHVNGTILEQAPSHTATPFRARVKAMEHIRLEATRDCKQAQRFRMHVRRR